MYEVERKIEVEWARNAAEAFPVRIVVHTDDRPGIAGSTHYRALRRERQHPQAWKRRPTSETTATPLRFG